MTDRSFGGGCGASFYSGSIVCSVFVMWNPTNSSRVLIDHNKEVRVKDRMLRKKIYSILDHFP